ncbi:hypothetical protein H257_07888 [Aphanomyces astaci]|uniref:Uncharacterized protein n=1 Tax=Aphanomyces astaci TaxID=112090 RepID=W4GH63_APHAT|nr:hypothetical protein H257_07888 [Aphanomyces astaci]ETV78303.1 hypothetical protein H257_07888 [Aphanomyces astaci]|eukprot:XP_009831884.1 hypothetical protein H257_07888 [Aphanomyces astaci]
MTYLCKIVHSQGIIGHSQGVVNLDPGLPAWHPITVQSAFNDIWTFSSARNKVASTLSACPQPTQQGAQNRTISSLLFVDDTLDISTSYAGIQDRAGISNYFTGQSASGSVFGADKSFLFYLSPRAHPDIALNDGLGIPQPICVIAPSKGFAT